ncbi:MAG: DVUA0089 family protein [Stenomitos rutilans HA7619-LM2]|nr:DVUA0089 family protein [Stenomitos rutilans HA7619-LM2]
MHKLAPAVAVSVLAVGLSAVQAQAVTFSQVGDTGQTLDTAQVIPGGTQSLDAITGTLSSPNVVNLFRLVLAGGQTFSATTINANTLIELPIDQQLGSPTALLPDPQLFLFDAAGRGVYGNDDSFGTAQASLPSGSFSPVAPGTYFLAIASSGYNPISAGGSIFGSPDASGILAANGSGSAAPLTGFTGDGTAGGDYQISFTGVTANAAGVPEPSEIVGTIAAGLLCIGYQVRKSLKRRSPV